MLRIREEKKRNKKEEAKKQEKRRLRVITIKTCQGKIEYVAHVDGYL